MMRLFTLAWDGLSKLFGFEPDLVSTVTVTDITLKMVGSWKYGNDILLIVERQADRIEFLVPYNETWRAEISNARIDGQSVRFTQRNYCKKMFLHPFNGSRCKYEFTLLDDDRLESKMKTWMLRFFAPVILSRAE